MKNFFKKIKNSFSGLADRDKLKQITAPVKVWKFLLTIFLLINLFGFLLSSFLFYQFNQNGFWKIGEVESVEKPQALLKEKELMRVIDVLNGRERRWLERSEGSEKLKDPSAIE